MIKKLDCERESDCSKTSSKHRVASQERNQNNLVQFLCKESQYQRSVPLFSNDKTNQEETDSQRTEAKTD